MCGFILPILFERKLQKYTGNNFIIHCTNLLNIHSSLDLKKKGDGLHNTLQNEEKSKCADDENERDGQSDNEEDTS